jgi:hypothetical protein
VTRAVVGTHAGTIDLHTGPQGTCIRLLLPWAGSPERWVSGDGWHEAPGWDADPGRDGLSAEVAALGREVSPAATVEGSPVPPAAPRPFAEGA